VTDDGIVRTCAAGSLAEARVRLRPIPAGHMVLSAASYAQPLPVPTGTIRDRLARSKTPAQRLRSERNKRYQRRKRGENIPLMAKGTPNEKLRRLVLQENVRGRTDAQIARQAKVSHQAVRHTRRLLNLPSAYERLAHQVAAYRSAGWSARVIAERLGVWSASVCRILRRANGVS